VSSGGVPFAETSAARTSAAKPQTFPVLEIAVCLSTSSSSPQDPFGILMSQGQTGSSPFDPPDLEPVLSQADDAFASAGAPRGPARRRFARRALVGVLLVVAVVPAATLATAAALFGAAGGGADASAPNVVLHVRPSGVSGIEPVPPVLEIVANEPGTAEITLLGGASFASGASTQSVRVDERRTLVPLRFSPETFPGVYGLKVVFEDRAGNRTVIQRPIYYAGH
jgi:hypothetical protein